jgi:hypothetical protein
MRLISKVSPFSSRGGRQGRPDDGVAALVAVDDLGDGEIDAVAIHARTATQAAESKWCKTLGIRIRS